MPAKAEKPRLTGVHIQAHGVIKDGEYETPLQMAFAMTSKEYATFDLQKAMADRHAEELAEARKTPAARKVERRKAQRTRPRRK